MVVDAAFYCIEKGGLAVIAAAYDQRWGDGLLGDKTYSVAFDNTKIKRLVPDFAATIPFSQGAEEIIAWHDADPARKIIDEELDRTMNRIISDWRKAPPG